MCPLQITKFCWLQELSQSCTLAAVQTGASNNSYLQMQCSQGYTGPACSVCLRNETHSYGRTSKLGCKRCKPAGLIIFGYCASTVLVLLLLHYTIQASLLENLDSASMVSMNDYVRPSELLKVGFCCNLLQPCLYPFDSLMMQTSTM